MGKKLMNRRLFACVLTAVLTSQCFSLITTASELPENSATEISSTADFATNGYNASITFENDGRPGDNDGKFIRVSNLKKNSSGILFEASNPDFTLDMEKTYKLSMWIRTAPNIGLESEEEPQLRLKVGNVDPRGVFGWAGINHSLKYLNTITDEWTEYSAIFKAAKACSTTVNLYREANAASVVPFDIDGITFIEVEKNSEGEWVPVEGARELINEVVYSPIGSSDELPTFTTIYDTEFYRIARVNGTNTAFSSTDDKVIMPGEYIVTGDFRLGEFDYKKLTYNVSTPYIVDSDNNSAKLTAKLGNSFLVTSEGENSFTITDDWSSAAFKLKTSEKVNLSDIVFSLDGAYTLDFNNISVLPLSIGESLPPENLLASGDFNSEDILTKWDAGTQILTYKTDANGGYIEASDITNVLREFTFDLKGEIPAGTYKFTGWFRTAVYGEVSQKRIQFYDTSGKSVATVYANLTNDWLKVEHCLNLTSALSHIVVIGGPYQQFFQSFCMDNFSFVPISSMPSSNPNRIGTTITPSAAYNSVKGIETTPWDPNEDYEVQGLMINHDSSNYFSNFSKGTLTADDVVRFCNQFKDTHVTDYFINVDGVFPAPGTGRTSSLEYYHMTEFFDGEPVDFSSNSFALAGHIMYEELGIDYIGIWCDTFTEIGINPWISFRMNDVHYYNNSGPSTSKSEFWYKNPQFRRVNHHFWVDYMDKAFDYTYEEVREHMLSYINAALNRYNCYGIELDFQRELRLFRIGGEYPGLEIMNQFMRDVDDLVAIYEAKYGHEIKISARVAPDPQTSYEFGLDVITWAAEGIVQLLSPTGRYESHYTDMPIKMWDSILEPYDVVLAPCIDVANLRPYSYAPKTGANTIETLAATAAYMYSQGADKMYTYNYFMAPTTVFSEADKVNTKNARIAMSSGMGMWNIFTTLGSYEKVNTYNRRSVLTYSDMHTVWRDTSAVLPAWPSPSQPCEFRIPTGDILDGSTVTLKFSVREVAAFENPPEVYVNNVKCAYTGMETCSGGFTEYNLMCYAVPRAAHVSDAMIVKIIPKQQLKIAHAEIYIQAPNS